MKSLRLHVLLLFLSKCNGIFYRHYMTVHSLSESVMKVIQDVGENESFLTCISIKTANSLESYHQHSDIINHIARDITKGISIISMDDRNETFYIGKFKEQMRFNVFIVDGLNGFRILSNQIPKGNFVFDGKFLVVINNSTMDYTTLVAEIFLSFFYQYIINVNILIPNPLLEKQILMFTYYPYKPDSCSWPNVELHNVYENESFLHQKQHFPNKLQNFYNCSIDVATFNITTYMKLIRVKNGKWQMMNIEGKLLNTIADLLNINIRIHLPSGRWGRLYPNRTISGAYGMLYNNIVNVTIGSFSYQSKAFELFDLTWSYHTTYLCFFVPPGRPFTSLEKTIWPFKPQVWYIMLLAMLIKIIIQITIKMLPQNRFLDHIDILNMIRIYFGLSITKYPVKLLSKIFVVGMFFSALILRTCYQSSLFHLMTVMVNVSTVNSVDEMIQQDFQFYAVDSLNSIVETIPQISSRTMVVDENEYSKILKDAKDNPDRKIAILSSRDLSTTEMSPVKENIYPLAIAMALRKNSYLKEIFNDVIYKLLANGYVSELHNGLKVKNHKKLPSSTGLLCMADVVSLFGICLVGYVLAFAIFILEQFSMIFKKNKAN